MSFNTMYPDMEGKCDEATRKLIEKFCEKNGFKVVRNEAEKMEGSDITIKNEEGVNKYLDLEVCMRFHNGVYHSPVFNEVSIPLRKMGFLTNYHTYWVCVSKDKKHIIRISGRDVVRGLTEGTFRIREYHTDMGIVPELFIMVPMQYVQIIEI